MSGYGSGDGPGLSAATHDSELGNFTSGGQRGDTVMMYFIYIFIGIPMLFGVGIVIWIFGFLLFTGHIIGAFVYAAIIGLLAKIYIR